MTDRERSEYERLKAQAERRKAYDRERYQRARRALAFVQAQGVSLDANGTDTNSDAS